MTAMNREDDGGSTPRPDPTVLTTQQLFREMANLRELIAVRIEAAETAVQIQAVSTAKEFEHAKELRLETFKTVEQQFKGIEKQFVERDVRVVESATAASTAVQAALQAAKEAVGEANRAFQTSIDKSEAATTKIIDALKDQQKAENAGLVKQVDDLKERVVNAEGKLSGGVEQRHTNNESLGLIVGAVGILIALASLATVFIAKGG